MLLELAITDFAIIDRLRLTFAPGLNVLTGETGTGKSILIDAVHSLLGGRCGPEYVRTGSELARVEGVFALARPSQKVTDSSANEDVPTTPNEDEDRPLPALLEEYGVSGDDDSVILCREIHPSGRTSARINGRAVPVAILQRIGSSLVDVHGQGDHLSLLRVSRHSLFLDRYAALLEKRAAFRAGVVALRQVQQEIDTLLRDERETARRVDLLRFQVEEIRQAALTAREEAELAAEQRLLGSAEQLATGARAVFDLLQGGTEDERGAIDSLGEAMNEVVAMARLDPTLEAQARSLREASYQLEDVAATMRRYAEGVEFNPARLKAVEDRLDVVHKLKRKYGNSVDEILRFADEAATELDIISHGEERVDELRHQEGELIGKLAQLAEQLSGFRTRAAQRLAAGVERELADLGMAGTRFEAACGQTEDADGLPLSDGRRCRFDTTGIDCVEFLVSTNQGEPHRPLVKIASGGETSRLMLALKTILGETDAVPTLIFDEIDAGIGGRTGQVVGQKLATLSTDHQVLCITHLPQIACFADAHFQIAKQIAGERTVTRVREMDQQERIDEIAIMLGGLTGSATAQDNAKELLARASSWKQALTTEDQRQVLPVS